jgi:hypothetical protein
MMTDLPPAAWSDMQAALDRTVQASAAVAAGIATHAQKQAVARDEARRKAEADRRLTAATGPYNA